MYSPLPPRGEAIYSLTGAVRAAVCRMSYRAPSARTMERTRGLGPALYVPSDGNDRAMVDGRIIRLETLRLSSRGRNSAVRNDGMPIRSDMGATRPIELCRANGANGRRRLRRYIARYITGYYTLIITYGFINAPDSIPGIAAVPTAIIRGHRHRRADLPQEGKYGEENEGRRRGRGFIHG